MRQFKLVVVGDVTNASGNEAMLRKKGVQVDILEDSKGIALYAKYRQEKPDLDLEDWKDWRPCQNSILSRGGASVAEG